MTSAPCCSPWKARHNPPYSRGPAAAGHALERALDLAEPNGTVMAFLLHPAPGLLERPARQRTALASRHPQPARRPGSLPTAEPRPLLEALSGSEIRVLCYLPANRPGRSGFRLQATPPLKGMYK